MSIMFISDVHLCVQEPKVTARFLRFLRYCAVNAEALYILGDLFKLWIGDDDFNPLYQEVIVALNMLKQSNVPCYFIHGNRDFLLGQHFADSCGIILLPEQQILEISGHRIIILHGDTLCTNDLNYQNFRRLTQNYWTKQLFLLLPLSIRRFIANKISRILSNSYKTKKIIDNVNLQKVMTILSQTKSIIMIHGHTHQPAIHKIINFSGIYFRAVLGAWYQYGSVIKINKKKISLIKLIFMIIFFINYHLLF